MDDIYSLLNLPKNASREELKAAFIAWKKPKQEILRKGTREEQAQASKEISEMTTLYKAACEISDTTKFTRRETTLNTNSSRNFSTETENISPPPPNSNSTPTESNRQKFLTVALCAVVVIQNTNNSEPEKNNPPVVEDKNPGKTPAKRETIQTLIDFHDNITKKSLRQAYDCMSYDLQNQISYEDWAPGFNNTVSSTPSNIKIVSDSADNIVLTYDLTAVDNPCGTKVFAGTVTMINTDNGWKIYDVINRNK